MRFSLTIWSLPTISKKKKCFCNLCGWYVCYMQQALILLVLESAYAMTWFFNLCDDLVLTILMCNVLALCTYALTWFCQFMHQPDFVNLCNDLVLSFYALTWFCNLRHDLVLSILMSPCAMTWLFVPMH